MLAAKIHAISGPDDGFSPDRQAIIRRTNNGGFLWLIAPLETHFSECRLESGGHFVSALMC